MIITLDSTLLELHEQGIISIRTYNGLHYNGLNTLRDIHNTYPNLTDLLSISKFGKKSLYEITQVFSLLEESIVYDVSKCESESKCNLVINIKEIIAECYNNIFLEDTNCEYLLFLSNEYPNPVKLYDRIINTPSKVFNTYVDFDYADNIKIRDSIIDFVKSVYYELDRIDSDEKMKFLAPCHKALTYLETKRLYFPSLDKYLYFFTSEQKNILVYEYNLLLKQVSTRTENIIHKLFPQIIKILHFVDSPEDCLRESGLPKIIPGVRTKTYAEILRLLNELKDKLNLIFESANTIISHDKLKIEYPFLLNSQRNFIQEHKNNFGYFPYFYILYNYLRVISVADRNIRIFCNFNGISIDAPMSLKAIAKQEDLTIERIRQIVNSTAEKIASKLHLNFSVYSFFSKKTYLLSSDENFLTLKTNESLNIKFSSFGILSSVYSDFRFLDIKGFQLLLKKNLFKRNSLENIIDNIKSLHKQKRFEDNVLPYSYFDTQINSTEQDILKAALNYFNFSDIIIGEDSLILKRNFINPSFEIVKILEKHGEPMFLSEIFSEFKTKFPQHKFEKADKLRAYIRKPIIAIGRQSRYALDGWGYNYNSINELLYDIVSKSNVPLHINNIFDEVLKYFPKTTIRSVENTMAQDDLERFIIFTNGFYGIEGKSYPQNFIKSNIVRRYTFEQRLQMFKDFIESYKRFPLSSGGEIESSLYRWYYNLSNNVLDVTAEQLELFNRLIQQCEKSYIPRTGFEIEFLNNCLNYKSFIKDNHILPNRDNGTELYYWLIRSKENFNSYTDYRRIYFTDLLSYIASFGFNI